MDLRKTLAQLEDGGVESATFPSSLAITCHALRQKPLQEFTIEDLRIMIGQSQGLMYLMPLALERLEEDPLVEGDSYAGDLLQSVLTVEPEFWKSSAHLRVEAARLGERAVRLAEERGHGDVVKKALMNALRSFQGATD